MFVLGDISCPVIFVSLSRKRESSEYSWHWELVSCTDIILKVAGVVCPPNSQCLPDFLLEVREPFLVTSSLPVAHVKVYKFLFFYGLLICPLFLCLRTGLLLEIWRWPLQWFDVVSTLSVSDHPIMFILYWFFFWCVFCCFFKKNISYCSYAVLSNDLTRKIALSKTCPWWRFYIILFCYFLLPLLL